MDLRQFSLSVWIFCKYSIRALGPCQFFRGVLFLHIHLFYFLTVDMEPFDIERNAAYHCPRRLYSRRCGQGVQSRLSVCLSAL